MLGDGLEFCQAGGEGGEVEAIGFDNSALGVAFAVAFPVRTVPHGDKADLDHVAIEGFGLGDAKAKGLLLQPGGRPDDRLLAGRPVLGLGKAEQPVNRVDHPRPIAEGRGRGFESGQHPAGRALLRQPGEGLSRALGCEHGK